MTRDLPVIFLTTDDDKFGRARELGAAAYLRKPILADVLLEAVGQHAARDRP